MKTFDAIVVGGGIAGSTTAAALSREGLQVLLCEAGLPGSKRLAGELLHPPGVANLKRLGLLDALLDAGAVPQYGFAVFPAADDEPMMLSNSEVHGARPTGLALEHAVMTRALLDAASAMPGVTVWQGARVLEVDFERPRPRARIRLGGEEREVDAALVVSAEGRGSKIRERAGIAVSKTKPFRMLGWKIPGGRLPYPGYGHVFVGGPTPTLAYQVGRDDVRIMFELERGDGLEVTPALMDAIPEPFRGDVGRAMTTEPRSTARVFGLRPARVTARALAVVGDAGGCVHPLTASGMSFCIGDAVRLGNAFTRSADVERALAAYESSRLQPMATRAALGPAMVEALCSDEPSMRLLRHGLFRYWQRSPRGRSVSMGLLSTHVSSMPVMAREYAAVCAHALTGVRGGAVRPAEVAPALGGLVRRTVGFLREAMRPV